MFQGLRLVRPIVWFVTFLGCAAGLFDRASRAVGADDVPRPNIVLIYADDLGYGDVGCFGAQGFQTPRLDRLAAEGKRFTSFYVAQPVCTASRAALMTGCYSNRVSLYGALNHQSNIGIHPDERLLPELLHDAGYATAIFGKWHLGHRAAFLPTRHGFDEFLGIPYSNDNGPLHPIMRDIPSLPLIANEETVELDPDQALFTRRFTDRAIQFVERNRERPFFLYLPHVMPHVPIFASPKFKGRTARLYGDVVEELDAGIGELVDAIDRLGLAERTLIVFASDNGPFLSYGDHAGSAGKLREGKLTTWEGGVRVPCVMRWKGSIPSGSVSHEIASTIDLLPTFMRWAGAAQPTAKLDGLDIRELITGPSETRSPRQSFYFYAGDELHAVRSGPWKLHVPHEYLTVAAEPGQNGKPSNFANLKPESMSLSGLRGIASRHGYRVVATELALYNLVDDPGEQQNIAEKLPAVVAELQQLVEQARVDLGDSLTKRRGANVRPVGSVPGP
ncbi:MAG: sulfatase [Planctomycetaceae bacterium]|nr:sulfatase [Planctomycetaceae bacterium]